MTTARLRGRQLDSLAEQTGGEVFSAQREEDLEDVYRRVAANCTRSTASPILPTS